MAVRRRGRMERGRAVRGACLSVATLGALFAIPFLQAQQAGKIMRPADQSALASGEVDIVATAPEGKLELDGNTISAEQPFPNVFHAKITPPDGKHTLAVVWEGGRTEVEFFLGPNPPPEFKAFVQHPPVEVACTQCHGISRRGRFRFEGGCFGCHQEDQFTSIHPHPVHIIEQCGMCHNAHGSTETAHMIRPREIACKQCHN